MMLLLKNDDNIIYQQKNSEFMRNSNRSQLDAGRKAAMVKVAV